MSFIHLISGPYSMLLILLPSGDDGNGGNDAKLSLRLPVASPVC